MSHFGVVKWMVPTDKIVDITNYFGLKQRKNSKTETLIAGCGEWAKFIDIDKLAGVNIYISAQRDNRSESGLEILNSNWNRFLQALNQNFWDHNPQMKPNPGALKEVMAMHYPEHVVQVAIMAALPFCRLGNMYSERGLYVLEIPTKKQLGLDDTERVEPTNEIFEPLFGAFDDMPAHIEAINYSGLVAE